MKFADNLKRKALLAYAFAIVLLLIIAFVSYRAVVQFGQSAATVSRTHQITSMLQATLGDLLSAESEARGYVISTNQQHLDFYETAIGDVQADLRELRKLVQDPINRERLEELEKVTQARLERLQLTVDTRRHEGLDAVVEAAGVGKKLMDEVRRSARAIETRQNELLNLRHRKTDQMASRTIMVVLGGGFLAIIVAVSSAFVLMRDITQREQLEMKVLETREQEQRRIAQDLHDGVCQQLTGISLLTRSLCYKLEGRMPAEAEEAKYIMHLLNESLDEIRSVARGLHPVSSEPNGLMTSLRQLAEKVTRTSRVDCQFYCPIPVPVPGQAAATQLYRIAQEAVQNSVRHATANAIVISLQQDDSCITLNVSDDGIGFPEHEVRKGLGLEIMDYRARNLHATLQVGRGSAGGTLLTCSIPRTSLN